MFLEMVALPFVSYSSLLIRILELLALQARNQFFFLGNGWCGTDVFFFSPVVSGDPTLGAFLPFCTLSSFLLPCSSRLMLFFFFPSPPDVEMSSRKTFFSFLFSLRINYFSLFPFFFEVCFFPSLFFF